MDTTLKQVGQLLLDAIPTVVLLLLLYAIYQNLVRKPLQKVLEERRNRTEGAVQKARADVAAAEARTQEYEQKLRDARLAIFKAQETRRNVAQQAKAEAIAAARAKAQEQVRLARLGIEQDAAAARTGLQGDVERLANDIVRTILKAAGSAPMTGGAQ
jgi:F-type H+-transporting ATPase subunit b